MSKLLIIETITWKPHIEAAMEIAIHRSKAGNVVEYYNLRNGLPVCEDSHPIHRLVNLPKIRVHAAHQLMAQRQGIEHHIGNFSKAESLAAIQSAQKLTEHVRTNEDLKKLEYKGFHDIGWGALSSAISVKRDSTINYSRERKLLTSYLASSILVYDRSEALIHKSRPDQVLLFNGRFATTRPVMRAAESCGVPWLIHERGRDKDHYWLGDCQPHNYEARQVHIRRSWKTDQVQLAQAFYQDRRNRIEREWHSFTKSQKFGKLPPALEEEGEWVTFFTSSDDELIAIGDESRNSHFPTQWDAIKAVHEVVAQLPGLGFCIRIHPHIAQKSSNDRSTWENFELPGAVIVGPAEDIDTYALMDRSSVVACYGSTVGVEATFWRKPSMLLGNSFYDRLNVTTVVRNREDIREFCLHPKVHSIEGALMYGAYFRTLGTKFEYYKADNLHRGEILGRNLDDCPQMRLANMVRSLWRSAYGSDSR